MHVATSSSHRIDKNGVERIYQTHLLRRSVREGSRVRKETLANLSHLPPETIEAVRASLAGKTLRGRGRGASSSRVLSPTATVAAGLAHGQGARSSPSCWVRRATNATSPSRSCSPAWCTRLRSSPRRGGGTTRPLATDLGLEDVSTDEVYAAMDWLFARQDAIEAIPRPRHLSARPTRRAALLTSPPRGWRGPRTAACGPGLLAGPQVRERPRSSTAS